MDKKKLLKFVLLFSLILLVLFVFFYLNSSRNFYGKVVGTACGDGIRISTEECDDGNYNYGDGCSRHCLLEAGWQCSDVHVDQTEVTTACTNICGDGRVVGNEQCDNGYQNSDSAADACRTNCRLASCGDGFVDNNEQCDDGNTFGTDGCSSACAVETGWACVGYVPSACYSLRCGDGSLQRGEECDDGNQVSGDGCSKICAFEDLKLAKQIDTSSQTISPDLFYTIFFSQPSGFSLSSKYTGSSETGPSIHSLLRASNGGLRWDILDFEVDVFPDGIRYVNNLQAVEGLDLTPPYIDRFNQITVDPLNTYYLWAATDTGIFRSFNNGLHWEKVFFPFNLQFYIYDVISSGEMALAIGQEFPFRVDSPFLSILRSFNIQDPIDEQIWEEIVPQALNFDEFLFRYVLNLFYLYDHSLWAVGNQGLLLKSTDLGLTWKSMNTDFRNSHISLNDIYFDQRGKRGWAVGEFGAILFTDNGGDNWQHWALSPEGEVLFYPGGYDYPDLKLFQVYFTDERHGFIYGYENYEGSLLFRTIDGGFTWDLVSDLNFALVDLDNDVFGKLSVQGDHLWISGRNTIYSTIFPDLDHDNIPDAEDNCPQNANLNQIDSNGDGDGDACELCGNGRRDAGEQCDDGNMLGADGCNSVCQTEIVLSTCGNGWKDTGEQCDDGRHCTVSGRACTSSSDCRLANDFCQRKDLDGCSSSCKREFCGDGYLRLGVEECDDATSNSDTLPNTCRTNCRLPYCGDGVLDESEECDDGLSGEIVNSNEPNARCRLNCRLAKCGDRILDSSSPRYELCDDGDDFNDNFCSNRCTPNEPLSYCGNSILESGEQCDDGNFIAGDGCSLICKLELSPREITLGRLNQAQVITAEGGASLSTCNDICGGADSFCISAYIKSNNLWERASCNNAFSGAKKCRCY